MTGSEMSLAVAAIIFAAFCLGWGACWLHQKFTRGSPGDAKAIEKLHSDLMLSRAELEQTKSEASEQVAIAQSENAETSEKYRDLLERFRVTQDQLYDLRSKLDM